MTKVCSKCGIEKDIGEFYKNGFYNGKQIYKASCKTCNRKKDMKRNRKFRELNPEKVIAYRGEYYRENKEKVNERCRMFHALNPEKSLERNRRRRAKKLAIDENYTSSDAKITRSVFDNKCFRCGSNKNITIDHNLCLNDGHALTPKNAVLLCGSCNSSKGTKNPKDFYSKGELQELNSLLRKAHKIYKNK